MCRVARSTARVVDRCDRRALRARGDPTRRRAIEASKIHARLTPTATGLRRRRRRRERLERALALGALEPHFAARVSEHIGRTIEELESTFKTRPTSYWEVIGRELDIPLAEVKTPTSGVTND